MDFKRFLKEADLDEAQRRLHGGRVESKQARKARQRNEREGKDKPEETDSPLQPPTPSRRSSDKPDPGAAAGESPKKPSPVVDPMSGEQAKKATAPKASSPDPGAAAAQRSMSSTPPKKPSPVVDPMRAYVGGQTAKPSAPRRGGIMGRLGGLIAGKDLGGKALRLGKRAVSSAVSPGGLIRQTALAATLPPELAGSEFVRKWRQYGGKTKKKGAAKTTDAPTGTEGTR